MSYALGAGPSSVAVPNRALWPDAIDTVDGFDRASRAEILVFSRLLSEAQSQDAGALKERLHLQEVDLDSIKKISQELWVIMENNYTIASASCRTLDPFCPVKIPDLRHDMDSFTKVNWSGRYTPWLNDALAFHRTYLNELLRLAALFPHISSEIDTFNINEVNGRDFLDRHFLLTFDDGPTSGLSNTSDNGGNTDLTLEAIRASHINGTFFDLGELFEARIQRTSTSAIQTLYAGMCVGSHGWLHKSHSTWAQWQDSVKNSSKLLHDNLPDSYVPLFRPPYGQRRADSGDFFMARGLKVFLWNIDSQDWNNKISADDAEQRVMALMLLWRHGIILFHDVHPKARLAVPHLISWTVHNGVVWDDCHQRSVSKN